jgi:hypothetical protein
MVDYNITFPMRPMKVSPPDSGIFSQFSAVLWAAIVACGALMIVVPPIPDLVSDFAIRNAARPLAGATIEHGECRVHLLLISCEATLLARRQGLPELRRKVDYWFFDFHSGNYTTEVMADPSQPEKMTTDLALDKLWNRTVTLLLLGPLFLLSGLVIVKYLFRTVRARRAVVRALSNQVLRPTILRLDSRNKDTWMVSSLTDTGAGKSCEWVTKGMPIFMDPSQNLVLGVTAGDGTACMPLDAALSWIDLTDVERTQLRERLGPERLPPGAISAGAPIRPTLARLAPRLAALGLVFATVAGTAAWLAFGEPIGTDYERIDLPTTIVPVSTKVRLGGTLQNQLQISTSSRVVGNTAYLDQFTPMTGADWRPGQPVIYLVKEISIAKTTPEVTVRRGTLMQDGLSADAITEFKRNKIAITSPHFILEVEADDNSYSVFEIVLVAVAVCGFAALVLILLAMIGYRNRKAA